MSGYSSTINGKKGGRPSYSINIKIEIPTNSFVILTPDQYNTLIEKYGYKLIEKAVEILSNWLTTSPHGEKYKGKNNYGHFRSDGWVINTAKRSLE